MNDEATVTPAPATWSDVWDAAVAASEQTTHSVSEWAHENPKTATATAVAVGVGLGYLLFG